MYVLSSDNAIVRTMLRHGSIYMYVHGTCISEKYKRVCTWYVHGMYIQPEGYKHVYMCMQGLCS